MFQKNEQNNQIYLISNVNDLPKKHRKRLENSWAGVFYEEFFCRLKEEPFSVLYAEIPSRPNIPVNVLVGLEYIKAGFGWSDEELYDAFIYNMQVRYALGYHQLGEGDFELRTLYNFRQRLSQHMQVHGVNLLDQAFEQVTDEQIAAFKLKTGKQRMDSTFVASNIRKMGRLQLLVEVLQRVHRMLNESDQEKYAEVFGPYLNGHAGQYVYRVKGQDTSKHIRQIGIFTQRLLIDLKEAYAEEAVYQVLERVFGEHYCLDGQEVLVKTGDQLSASSLQSPDDLEAAYREKAGRSHRGYVANISESCDPENSLQLITKVQVEPNNTDDAQMLVEALPNLKERTDLDTLFTDGGHGSPQADEALTEYQVTQVQTAIRGRTPHPEKLHLSDFEIKQTKMGKPVQITCPGKEQAGACPYGQQVAVKMGSKRKGFVAHFDEAVCQACQFSQTGQCPARPGKRDVRFHLYFSQQQAQVSQRRRRSAAKKKEGRNLRAAVEATVREVKHPFPAGKLSVRGKFRITCMLIGSSAMTNVRRIQRYLATKQENECKETKRRDEDDRVISFCASIILPIQRLVRELTRFETCVGC
ncbi:MAG: transposase [Anaerolineales bacterium]